MKCTDTNEKQEVQLLQNIILNQCIYIIHIIHEFCMSHMSPSLLTTVQALAFCVILVFWIVSYSCICIILLFWIKEEIRYGTLFNKTVLNTVPVQFRFFQKAGAERNYLEIYQTKAEDVPSKIAV